jgi:hypothetical protein
VGIFNLGPIALMIAAVESAERREWVRVERTPARVGDQIG